MLLLVAVEQATDQGARVVNRTEPHLPIEERAGARVLRRVEQITAHDFLASENIHIIIPKRAAEFFDARFALGIA